MGVESRGRQRMRTRRKSALALTVPIKKLSSIMFNTLVVNCSSKTKTKLFSTLFLLWGALLVGVAEGQFGGLGFEGMCPVPECYCGMDMQNRLEVDCSAGGLNDIPTSRMAPHIEVIRITAPKDGANHLKIGRTFRQFRKLEELHIVGSNVDDLGSNNFFSVSSLKLLNLTRNTLTEIRDNNFMGLNYLESLVLTENRISKLNKQCFRYLIKLRVLDLSRNRLSKLVDQVFDKLDMLELLDLSDNELREINADVFRDIWRLKEFRCQRCQLKGIPALWYSLLPALRKLDLRYNELKYLREGEFSALKSIQEIHLDGNRINVLSEEAFKLTRLHVLSLSYNGISSVDRTAFINASVHTLNLSGNKFESLNKLIFVDLKANLTSLDLSRNPKLRLSSLYSILTENTRLQWLSVARNNYEELPLDLFEDNRFLQHLNLSNNRLRELFPRHFHNLTNLQVLDLSYNRLLGVSSEVLNVFDRINAIREIRLEGNPWACDLCHILPLHKWMQTSSLFRKGCLFPNGPFCLRCRYPSNMYDKTIIHLEESSLEWCDPYADEYGDESRLGLFLGCGLLFLILVIIAGGILLKYQFSGASYYTHEDTRVDAVSTHPNPLEEEFGSQYYATINGTHTKMIATIDEKNFEPDANFYPDLAPTLNPLHPSYHSTAAVSPSIFTKNEHSFR